MKKTVIIYHPYGEKKFTTVDLGDDTYRIVNDICSNGASIEVLYEEDGGQVREVYCMQYLYEEWV